MKPSRKDVRRDRRVRRYMAWSQRWAWLAVVCAGLLPLLTPAAAWARFTPQPCKNAFSEQQEITEGQKAAAEVYKQMPVLPDDSPVSRYVEQLGMKLVRYAPGYKWPYAFHVADVADVNAFALPGGTIFVNLGTIQAAETEAQLAGVMAHEISHVVQRHSTCNLTKERSTSMWAGLGQLAAGVFLPGAAGQLAAQGIGLGAGLSFLKMSRSAEQQADLMGVDILYDAGYDPRGLPQFFEVIEGKYGKGGAQFLSDHPNPGNRIGYVNDEIATLPPRANSIKTSAEFTRIKGIVAGMHAYTAKEVASGVWKKQGASSTVASGVEAPSVPVTAAEWTPAGSWQTFDGSGFTISYPGNWKAYGGNGQGATLAPVGGVAEGGNGALTYGVVIGQAAGQQAGVKAGTEQLVAQLQQSNPGLKPGQATEVIVNGVHGRSLEATNTDAQGESGGRSEHDWIVTLPESDGSLHYLVFVAPEADFEKLRPVFEQMLRTMRLAGS